MATAMTIQKHATQVALAKPASSKSDQPLPLEPGDHLTRAEFERRYQAMPKLKKAELIEGIVYLVPRVRYKAHAQPHARIAGSIGYYSAFTPGVEAVVGCSLRLDLDNEPQPDVVLRIDESHGGLSRVTEDDYLEGSPELIVEVSSSTASYDLRQKLNVYRRNGIQEYLVWRVYDEQIDWFSLQDEQYVLLQPDENGIIESRVFPGLRLNVQAMLNGDLAKVLSDLQASINDKT